MDGAFQSRRFLMSAKFSPSVDLASVPASLYDAPARHSLRFASERRLFSTALSLAPAGRRVARWLRSAATALLMGVALGAAAQAQTAPNEWTWMGGSSTISSNCVEIQGALFEQTYCGQPGTYGTLGTPAAANILGGRYSASSWTDNSGNLWVFGGNGFDSTGYPGYLNDLWEFSPLTNQWVWMSGANTAGQASVYGTLGTPAAGNVPGGRTYASSWTDKSGNLWLFGGYGYIEAGVGGYLNDLWEFNVSTKQWAWMGGSSTVGTLGSEGSAGVYGTLGTAAAGNIPGSRYSASVWTDSKGNFWLFGGIGTDSTGNQGNLNDLWEYSPSSNEWTWMGGSSTVGPDLSQPGVWNRGHTCLRQYSRGTLRCSQLDRQQRQFLAFWRPRI